MNAPHLLIHLGSFHTLVLGIVPSTSLAASGAASRCPLVLLEAARTLAVEKAQDVKSGDKFPALLLAPTCEILSSLSLLISEMDIRFSAFFTQPCRRLAQILNCEAKPVDVK